jgi:RNA polymerase sigma factor (sigma-70 family)
VIEKMTNEAELLQASLGGSREAFGSVVERYQSLICGITYSATGDVGKSEELAQETFIRAWKGLRQLKDVERFRAWLCTIARNVVRTSIKRRRQDAIDTAKPLEAAEKIQSAEAGPAERAISKEQQDVVWGALERIPETYREPIVLFYRQKQSISQLATELGLSEDVARQRLSRGRKLLKAEVAEVVEDVLGRTRPSKVFTVAVIAALPAITAQTATAAVAGAAAKGAPAAKAAFLSGISGAVLGPLVGLLGGIFGTWMSIKHTKSARERRFVVTMAIVLWLALVLLIAVPLVLAITGVIPKWACWTSSFLFFALLCPFIIWSNARQRQIQIEEGTYVRQVHRPRKLTKANVYAAFGGGIFGSIAWIFPMSYTAKDWLVPPAVLIFAILLFIISTKICLRAQGKYQRIIIIDMMSIALLTLAVVNLRWERWMEFYRDSSSPYNMPLWSINSIILIVFSGLLVLLTLSSRKKSSRAEKNRKEDSENEI